MTVRTEQKKYFKYDSIRYEDLAAAEAALMAKYPSLNFVLGRISNENPAMSVMKYVIEKEPFISSPSLIASVCGIGQMVYLNGTSSGVPDENLSFVWSQTEGPPVVITDPNTKNAFFMRADGADLQFKFTVTNNSTAISNYQIFNVYGKPTESAWINAGNKNRSSVNPTSLASIGTDYRMPIQLPAPGGSTGQLLSFFVIPLPEDLTGLQFLEYHELQQHTGAAFTKVVELDRLDISEVAIHVDSGLFRVASWYNFNGDKYSAAGPIFTWLKQNGQYVDESGTNFSSGNSSGIISDTLRTIKISKSIEDIYYAPGFKNYSGPIYSLLRTVKISKEVTEDRNTIVTFGPGSGAYSSELLRAEHSSIG